MVKNIKRKIRKNMIENINDDGKKKIEKETVVEKNMILPTKRNGKRDEKVRGQIAMLLYHHHLLRRRLVLTLLITVIN